MDVSELRLDPEQEGSGVADTAPQTGAETASSSGGGFQIPQGHRLVPENEWSQLCQQANSWKGTSRLFEAARRAGIENFDSLTEKDWMLLAKAKQSQHYTPEVLLEQLYGDQGLELEQEQTPVSGLTLAEIRELVKRELSSEWETRSKQQEAMFGHETAMREEKRLLAEIRSELGLPESIGDDDHYHAGLDAALRGLIAQSVGVYPNGHPLAGRRMPLAEENARTIRERAKAFVEAFGARQQLDMARKAAGQNGTVNSAGPGRGPTSKADSNETYSEERERAELLAEISARDARRGGQPVSHR